MKRPTSPVLPSTARTTSRVVALTSLLTVAALSTTGCNGLVGSSSEGDNKGPIVLGMDIPMSGSSADIGPYMKNGAQLAIDEINAKGGVLGRKLKLQAEDDACDPKTAVAAANKLLAAGTVVSVGGYCSGATLPTLPVFGKQKIPMIIPAANSNELVAQQQDHVFLINGTGSQQADAAVKWLTKDGAKKVAVMDDNTSYSKDIADLTSVKLGVGGAPARAGEDSVNPGESDYSPNVTSVLKSNPDYIYWTGYYQEGGLLIRQFRQAGYKGKFLVGDGSVDAKLVEIAGAANGKGVYATMTQTPETTPGAESWIASYKKKFGSEPGPYSTQSYDAVRVAAEAIKKAGSTDGDKIIKALEGLNGFDMFSGPLKFTDDHTLSNGGFVILGVRNGKFVLQDSLK
ncbi:branched-chain amino acid ABC transporter substrate-binding protein [Streptomyces sp. NBC_01481]|uniref:branched-chain amino acid ABC transporter substrate-binding protein n=1 Tax=Streptomyces sp. NBC_01481 TaxID=2975869 RepID=UPI002259930F|nr:branched-chain amino acid ABC transporter substrate-binding protein [Streptomyces sp. NBC_01481]MCX4585527.1 branched-chain amino acid ABC transporter substrate-binding protein [Streptomyces sp. NBC_01481]